MAKKVEERIKELREELARLEGLAANPPELPEGFRVAEVVGLDTPATKFKEYLPDYGDLVVVPDCFDGEVWVYGDDRGNTIAHRDGRVWVVGYGWEAFGKTVEEAIAAYIDCPGRWEVDCG